MIDITLSGVLKVQKALRDQPKKINLVLSRAINRAATNAKANMAKKVREEYLVKASDVKKTIRITRATTRKPEATVRSAGQRINLTKFRLSPREPQPKHPPRAGYKSQVLKTGGIKVVPRGFLVNVRGSLAFMQREDGAGRLPIKRLMGPSVPQMIGRKSIIEWIETEARSMLNRRIDQELKQVLGVTAK